MSKKRVRILLRVSSNQQLEADGDMDVQRQLVLDYIAEQEDWLFDGKEYFEGGVSGYKNSVEDRDILQEVYKDAEKREYDILVVYKDDRIGRRMWEMGSYVMSLKSFGVDTYSVKDGCISPETTDIMGQMMLALRYGSAQKSSSDTGMRVKDTAQKLVKKGKFMGGKAPYGYILEYSGEISKHGRALKHLVKVSEQLEVVKYIFQLSFYKEYGSAKIAQTLNTHEKYKDMAPTTTWKGGTITSIIQNPIYAGYAAYKRRERINGKYHRLDAGDWIFSEEADKDIAIISLEFWNDVQEKRQKRNYHYSTKLNDQDVHIIKSNHGGMPLVDVLYCGYCGSKLTNNSKYNYWTIKATGEKKVSKIPIYRCQLGAQGIPHPGKINYKADDIENIVLKELYDFLIQLQKDQDIIEKIKEKQKHKKTEEKIELEKQKAILLQIQNKIDVLEESIPDAITNQYPLSLPDLTELIKKQKNKKEEQIAVIKSIEARSESEQKMELDYNTLYEEIPTWKDIVKNADSDTKRVLVNKLIKKIEVKENEVSIEYNYDLRKIANEPSF